MSAVKGVNRTKIDAMTPSDLLAPEVARGKVRYAYDEYEAAALAAASTIHLFPDLPKNAVIVDWRIDHDALGTGVTLAFGSNAANASLMAAAASATAGVKTMAANGVASSTGLVTDDVTVDAEKTKLKITTGGAAATGMIKAQILYVEKA